MIEFLLGFIAAILLATFNVVVLIFFRRVIEQKITIVEKKVSNAGPRPKGMIFEPPDEIDEAREKIIEHNNKLGRDTTFEELR